MGDGARLIVGSRIRSERERRGISQAELARQLGKTQTAISYWEAGRRVPDVEDIVALAGVLELEPGELLTVEQPPKSPRVLLRAEVERLELDDLADAVDAVVSRADETAAPTAELSVSVDDPVRAAQELIGLAPVFAPPVDVQAIARRCGVRVIGESFAWDVAISGFLVELESGPIIGFNSAHSHGRQRFTVAHELGHYLLRHHDHYHLDMGSAMAHGEDPNYDWRDERKANEFAAELLMPAQMVMAAAQKHSTVQALANLFQVSKEAMGFRLINLGLR
jgi:Zn-dependent peptidase ImmA (M78 family)/DNA-binding XRE family transcriptional regulator